MLWKSNFENYTRLIIYTHNNYYTTKRVQYNHNIVLCYAGS